jgi:hypothetical protein
VAEQGYYLADHGAGSFSRVALSALPLLFPPKLGSLTHRGFTSGHTRPSAAQVRRVARRGRHAVHGQVQPPQREGRLPGASSAPYRDAKVANRGFRAWHGATENVPLNDEQTPTPYA